MVDMKTQPTLTIAIPTFNRNEILVKTVAQLMPQMNAQCELLILDNCSDTPVAESLGGMCETWPDHVRIVRNRVNIGADANIMRCIEFASNDFVWLLGDDDFPADDAVSRLLEELGAHPSVDVFKFFDPSTGVTRPLDSVAIDGAANYLCHTDSMGTLIFMSAMVLRVQKTLPHIATATFYQASCSSQLIVLLKMLESGSLALLSKYTLTPLTGAARPHEPKGLMPFKIATGLVLLLYPTWQTQTVNQIRKLLNAHWCLKMQIAAVCGLITLNRTQQLTHRQLRMYGRVLAETSKLAERPLSIARKLIRYGALPLVIWPRLGAIAVLFIYKIAYKS